MKDYNSQTWWDKFIACFATQHIHVWDKGHVWTPRDWSPSNSSTGFYYLCKECGIRWVTEYPN